MAERPSPLPSLAALRAFEAAARLGGYSAAAAELNVTQAAVGQQVRRLEAELGRRLMRPQGRGVALTEDGAALARGLAEGFGAIRAALAAFAEEDATRPLRVSMTPYFATQFLMPRLVAFRREAPDVALALDPSAALVDLAAGEADLAIRYGAGSWPGVEARMLLATPVVAVAAPGLWREARSPRAEELAALPWLNESGTDEVESWLRAQGVDLAKMGAVTYLPGSLAVSALLDGQGVAMAARALVQADLDAGRLRVLFEDGAKPGKRAPEDRRGDIGYHLLQRPGPLRPPAARFAKWLTREAKAAAS